MFANHLREGSRFQASCRKLCEIQGKERLRYIFSCSMDPQLGPQAARVSIGQRARIAFLIGGSVGKYTRGIICAETLS